MISNDNTTNFENNEFDLFEAKDILLNNINDDDFDIFNDTLQKKPQNILKISLAVFQF